MDGRNLWRKLDLILKKIDLETPSDLVGCRYVECDRLIKSPNGGFKQRRKEERGREMKRGGGGGFPPSLPPRVFLDIIITLIYPLTYSNK
jgi:hypothetical protein